MLRSEILHILNWYLLFIALKNVKFKMMMDRNEDDVFFFLACFGICCNLRLITPGFIIF